MQCLSYKYNLSHSKRHAEKKYSNNNNAELALQEGGPIWSFRGKYSVIQCTT
jgi:hypothetical protein